MLPLNFRNRSLALLLFSAAMAISSSAQTFTNLAVFDKTSGSNPIGNLAQGLDGNFYGTTTNVGIPASDGGVFQVTPEGVLTAFAGAGNLGSTPQAGILLATDGNFYGTTYWGGDRNACQSGCGTVFKVTPSGVSTTLHSFERNDGFNPNAGLIELNGNFYGTTLYGGGNTNCFQGCGTVFEITPTGTLTMLHAFTGADGKSPQATLVLGRDGNLYGTTYQGGSNNRGTFFKITPAGVLTMVHSFDPADATGPLGLVLGTDGNFYGMTASGGPQNAGTVFKITPEGVITRLHNFVGSDGAIPAGALVQATDGNFYGATRLGGSNSCFGSGFFNACGTIFEMTSAGVVTTLHSFDGTDGERPLGGLVQATDGNLYGTTYGGGVDCGTRCGTVFKWSTGLAPFVTPLPASGHDGNTVRILGTDLTGATLVTFNGKEAKFTIVSSTEIKATVPMCVKTGLIEVTTPGGKLTSNVVFTAN